MWNNLEHQIWSLLKLHSLENENQFLLALSGGIDSMSLLNVIKKIKPQSKIIIMHYHHGEGININHRNECLKFIKSLADESKIFLEYEIATHELESENEYRNARLFFFEKIKLKYKVNYYLTAHHLDDVLETRLIKMIRGTGLEGLESFKDWNNEILRPFFYTSKKNILDYAIQNKITWIDDPTNSESIYLRNWIRNEWLPALEIKSMGSVKVLAQSIQNIIEDSHKNEDPLISESLRYVVVHKHETIIDKSWFLSLGTKDQLRVLIRVIKASFPTSFSVSQIKEVLRRLDKNQNDHIFEVANIKWVINMTHIVLRLKSSQ